MFGSLTFETLAVLSIFVFRFRLPHAERPYRCLGYPVTPLLYVLLPGFVLANLAASDVRQMLEGKGVGVSLVGIAFIGVGAAVYYALGLQRRSVPAGTLRRGTDDGEKGGSAL
jgi:hypothetical protein